MSPSRAAGLVAVAIALFESECRALGTNVGSFQTLDQESQWAYVKDARGLVTDMRAYGEGEEGDEEDWGEDARPTTEERAEMKRVLRKIRGKRA